jgi:hypothetical protein
LGIGKQLSGLNFGCFADHLEEHLLHEVGFLDCQHFFKQFGGCGSGEVFEKILAVLQHESQKVNVVIHFEEQLDGLLFFAHFEHFNNVFPLFDEHKVGIVGLKLIWCGFLRGQVAFGVFLLLKGLDFFEIG